MNGERKSEFWARIFPVSPFSSIISTIFGRVILFDTSGWQGVVAFSGNRFNFDKPFVTFDDIVNFCSL